MKYKIEIQCESAAEVAEIGRALEGLAAPVAAPSPFAYSVPDVATVEELAQLPTPTPEPEQPPTTPTEDDDRPAPVRVTKKAMIAALDALPSDLYSEALAEVGAASVGDVAKTDYPIVFSAARRLAACVAVVAKPEETPAAEPVAPPAPVIVPVQSALAVDPVPTLDELKKALEQFRFDHGLEIAKAVLKDATGYDHPAHVETAQYPALLAALRAYTPPPVAPVEKAKAFRLDDF